MSVSLTELLQLFKGTEIEQTLQKMWEDNPDKAFITQEANKGEANKLKPIRLTNGFFDLYAPEHLSGIDIGCGFCPVNETFRRYDYLLGDGDAMLMADISDNKFYTVHTCHLLEHMSDPVMALQNWVRITKPSGHIIVVVPDRDLYEGKKERPSSRNPDHKFFYTSHKHELPHTLGLEELAITSCPNTNIVQLTVYSDGYKACPNGGHPDGNYSIELVLQKLY